MQRDRRETTGIGIVITIIAEPLLVLFEINRNTYIALLTFLHWRRFHKHRRFFYKQPTALY